MVCGILEKAYTILKLNNIRYYVHSIRQYMYKIDQEHDGKWKFNSQAKLLPTMSMNTFWRLESYMCITSSSQAYYTYNLQYLLTCQVFNINFYFIKIHKDRGFFNRIYTSSPCGICCTARMTANLPSNTKTELGKQLQYPHHLAN